LPDALVAVTVREAIGRAAGVLAAAGCETPRLDAELLLGEVLGVERARLVVDAGRVVEDDVIRGFDALVQRRAAREPVAYILGRRSFRRLSVAVDRRVLIPRPETELLVEVALTLRAGARVVDVGTGSGAVALAVAVERPDLEVWGVDVSADALEVARLNASRLGLSVRFVQGDLLEGVSGMPFDAVLANLPYVASGEACALAPEISGHEPAGALFAGPDGLSVIRRLVSMLSPEVSLVALEIGVGQGDEVASMVRGAGFGAVERLRDLAGHERVVVGRR
jgi:release factor glutamine methyltransferase